MRDDSLKASVNYGDYEGTAAADRHDRRNLSDLAEKYGVDTDRYFVFGVNVHIGETRGDKLAHTFVSILAVDMQEVKAGSVDYIQKYVDEHDGVLPYMRFDISASLEEVLLSFKRFNVVLTNSHITRVREYQQA
ncbi:MAG TPA: hypothetical protein VKB86_17445 [Pyrinomonadaceae bacterium]|nr:hypothetical protein [Pyrinomonadaceae bacterium]